MMAAPRTTRPGRRRRRVVCALALASGAGADFVYVDFNETQGLVLNGMASTTACSSEEIRNYGPRERDDADGALGPFYGEDAETSFESEVQTHTREAASDDEALVAKRVLYHRDAYREEDRRCAGRVRLTPSQPHAAGSAWYHRPLPVFGGFETTFGFKISDQSRECTRHRDLDFSLELYENCYVHGGDGLAFVVQADGNGSRALGLGGGEVGFGGIAASVAVEFDTSYNPGADFGPLDHVSVRARGPERANSALADDALLAPNVVHDVADGREHFARVAYLPRVALEYFDKFAATTHIEPFVVDGGDRRRIGTFVVWLDEGIATDDPAIAFPVNLPALLGLDGDGEAYVGFTAATGRRWEKHDVTSWHVCDREDCFTASVPSEEKRLFDYHTTSRTSGLYQPSRFSPGGPSAFGGDVRDASRDLPRGQTTHTNPDNSPITPPKSPDAVG